MHDNVRRGTKNLLRDINNSRVLQIIQARGPISRAEIAKIAQLPPPTVTSIVSDFLQAGLVRETDAVRDPSNGSVPLGRRPIMLTLNESAAFAVGVKLRQDGLTVAVTDLAGDPVVHLDRSLSGGDAGAMLEGVAATVQQAVAHAEVGTANILGVGIGMPGLIDHAHGVCRYSSLLGWRQVEVRQILEERLLLPVYVDNDVNMLTAAELAYGAGREASDFLTVTVGRGIGLGIVVRGEVFRGAFGGAGEFGHIKVGSDLRCECGEVGCLEAMASEIGIADRVARLRGLARTDIDDALQLARAGDPDVLAIFADAGRALGQGIGNLLNLFNPELVILTGEGTRIGDVLLGPVREAIRESAFGALGTDTHIEIQRWGDEAWARGAASIVVHEMLKTPIYESRAVRLLDQVLDRRFERPSRRS